MVDKPVDAEVLELSWDTVHTLCKALAYKILSSPLKDVSNIVAVVRGGCIPATIISHLIDKPISNPNLNVRQLIIDDISDTGKTFNTLSMTYPFGFRVALIAKPQGVRSCDAYVMQVPQHIWIKFPWEAE